MEQKPLSLEGNVIIQLQGKIGQLEGQLAFARAELQDFYQKNVALTKEVAKYQGESANPEENKEQA
jgi:hypothetical protein